MTDKPNNGKCRTCLATNRLLPLNTKLRNLPAMTYLDCLRNCTRLLVPIEDDKYPKHICVRCCKALEVATHFMHLARETELKLLQTFGEETMLKCVRDNTNVALADKINDEIQLVEFQEIQTISKQNSVAILLTAKEAPTQAHADPNCEVALEACTKNETPSGKVSVVAIANNEREVLTVINNQTDNLKLTNSAAKANMNNTKVHAYSRFLAEIKENCINGARDLALKCSSATTQSQTTDVQNALNSNKAVADLVCMLCKKHFTDLPTFIKHRNRHKGITPFRCNACNYFTCYAESLRKHYKKAHNTEATHEMIHGNFEPGITPVEKPYNEITYKCTACTRETDKEHDIKVHLINEHLITADFAAHYLQAFNCPDCHRTFKDQRAMRTHFTFMHGTAMGIKKLSTDIYICEHCDKQFQYKMSLTAHQRVCQLREAVHCNICNQKFATMRKFEQHLRIAHAVATIHECEVCGKAFNNTESLTLHRKRHTERHFQCKQCPCNYINNTELRVHIERIHGTETKALCRICGMTFTHIGLLRKHENAVHFKRYFKCQFCDYKSTTRCNVRLHQFIHTGKPYKCEICGKEFSLRAKMRQHALNMHSIEMNEEQLAAMFLRKFGYPSRYDAFSKTNNSLEITEVNEEDIKQELQECGLNYDDIVKDLFAT